MIFDLLSDVAHTLWSSTTSTLADRVTNLLVLFTAFRLADYLTTPIDRQRIWQDNDSRDHFPTQIGFPARIRRFPDHFRLFPNIEPASVSKRILPSRLAILDADLVAQPVRAAASGQGAGVPRER